MSKMVRAKLQAADGAGSLEFTFNPTEYSVTKSAKWQTPPRNMKEKAGAKPEYLGSEPQTISMQIFFDDWETAIGDPLRLTKGDRILLPSADEAAEISKGS